MVSIMSNSHIDINLSNDIEPIHIENKILPSKTPESHFSDKTISSNENIKKINQKLTLLSELYQQENILKDKNKESKVKSKIDNKFEMKDDDSENVENREGLLLTQKSIINSLYIKSVPNLLIKGNDSTIKISIEKVIDSYQEKKNLFFDKKTSTLKIQKS